MYFFFNDTATTEIYTLSLHDALPIFHPELRRLRVRDHLQRHLHLPGQQVGALDLGPQPALHQQARVGDGDRKSTRLNSSHANISYAVFCLKKKKLTDVRTHSFYSHTD